MTGVPESTGRTEAAARGGDRRRARGTLATCGLAHLVHDGVSDALYVLLPIWAQGFGLSHAQVGLLKAVFSGAGAGFQVPAGFLAERWGERILLAGGTLVAGAAFILIGWAAGFASLALLLLIAGLAMGTQHPLSSSLVARAYEGGRRRAALGIYNFTGDLGKIAMPLLVASGAAAIGWRASSVTLGAFCLLAGLGVFAALRRLGIGAAPRGQRAKRRIAWRGAWGIMDRRGFRLLAAVGMIDTAVRSGFLTFLPFLLIAKGASVETVGFALALVFGGGAAGKLSCGFLAERIGIIRTVVLTECVTGAGIIALLFLPLGGELALLPLVGLALNGTSSVLYGTVPEFVAPETQARAFGLFYTFTSGAGAVSPALCGLLSDLAGVPATLAAVGVLALAAVPLCRFLAPSIEVSRAAG